MWHCQRCGICRAGQEEDFVHCDTCDACIRNSVLPAHACAPFAMHHECLVCSKYLFSSRAEVTQLLCGHLAVHRDCLPTALARVQRGELECPHCRPARNYLCSGASPPSAAAHGRSLYDSSDLEGLLKSLYLDDDDDDDAGPILECGRKEYSPKQVYVRPGAVTRGTYVRKFNELPVQVTPQPDDNCDGSRAVNTVVRRLQQIDKRVLSVDRVHVGGSFGRKTTVKGRWDVDLLIMANGFDPRDSARAEMILEQVAAQLQQHFAADVKVRPDIQMLQLELNGVEMDVPVVQNVATRADDVDKAAAQRRVLVAPLFHMTDAQVAAMARGEPDRARERAVSEALTEFVREQPTTANQAVRLFKAWVKCGLAERRLLRCKKLPSIALELIVLAAWQQQQQQLEQGGEAALPDISESRSLLLRVFVRALSLASRLLDPGFVVMLDAGARLGYTAEQGRRFRACWGREGPFIIHPIDPTCNVARDPGNGRPPWDWAGLVKQAGILLTVVRSCSQEVLLRESSLAAALYRIRHGIGAK